jgi:hypothetical protein
MSHFKELTERLEQDRGTPYPKYPDQALFALRDKAVAQAVERRFKSGASLVRIKSLGCHRASGLLHTVFEFTQTGAVALVPNAILAITDSQCKVVGLVDPFDSERPNPILPPEPAALPLALAQPSDADELVVSDEDLAPREVRTRAFLQQMNVTTGPGSGHVVPSFFAVDTRSVVGYRTQTVVATFNPATGKKTYTTVRYEVYGSDDTGVGGDSGMTPVE